MKSRGLFFGWWIVFASFVGLALGSPALALFTFGTFVTPIEADFGWSRSQTSICVVIMNGGTLLVAPLVGVALDRFGPRRVVLVMFPFFAASFASLSFVTSLPGLYLTWIAIAVFGAGVSTPSFSKAIVAFFERRLGLALGVAVTGLGIGAALLPPIAQRLIDAFGWRHACVALGAISFVAIAVTALPLLYDTPEAKGTSRDGVRGATETSTPDAASTGPALGVREAIRTKTFWLAAGAFFFLGLMTATITSHTIPMLLDAGFTPKKAPLVQAAMGMSSIFGRICVGFLLDRFFAPRVLIVSLVGVVAGLAIYASGPSGNEAFLAAALIGFGIGAELDVVGFLLPRYFGRVAYGKLYGLILAAFQLGGAIGAGGTGALRTSQASYTLAMWILTAGTVVAIGLLSRLGPYAQATARNP
jgi:MFS family permease